MTATMISFQFFPFSVFFFLFGELVLLGGSLYMVTRALFIWSILFGSAQQYIYRDQRRKNHKTCASIFCSRVPGNLCLRSIIHDKVWTYNEHTHPTRGGKIENKSVWPLCARHWIGIMLSIISPLEYWSGWRGWGKRCHRRVGKLSEHEHRGI